MNFTANKRLLIITQAVDKNNPLLGFFHRWIEAFAEYYEIVNVICLEMGEYQLPKNVKVLSLGKEKYVGNQCKWHIISRFLYLYRFYKYIFQERKNYDAVFVHMNPIYIVLGGIFWKIWGKKIFLWYIHPKADKFLKSAILLVDKIFTASPYSFPLKSEKLETTGHGIDLTFFRRYEEIKKIPNSLLFVGRISPVKNLHILIDAVNILHRSGINFVLNIVGDKDERFPDYFEKIKKDSTNLEKLGKIKFLGKIPNKEMPKIYNQNEILVNLTPSGSFDKAILEAMACGCLVLVANKSFEGVLPKEFTFNQGDFQDLASKLILALKLSSSEREEYGKDFSKYVVENHNLEKLIQKIYKEYEKFN
jgi:glycosyltransferase involved in cell wall biosynthesis